MTKWHVNNTNPLPQASMPDAAMHTAKILGLETDSRDNPAFAVDIIAASAGNSEFLVRLISQQPEYFNLICEENPEQAFKRTIQQLPNCLEDKGKLMQQLRLAKQQVALATAIADISGFWSVDEVVRHLSKFADEAVRTSCRSLLKMAHNKGSIKLINTDDPFEQSGLLVLAMGKHGAKELNYSSDIDLIVLFDPDSLQYSGRQNIQHFFTRLTQDMSEIMQQRTKDGYVFRTDLRLRPDPRSTPPAVNLNSAITYYESVGQNWERAAMIKARPIAADMHTAERFARAMEAFTWRRHLDFEAIADINSIKRQIDAKSPDDLTFAGHNVKLGRGGIREIEFFTQTQQLIWGGRDSALRQRRTVDALNALCEAEHITQETCDTLTESYWYLRRVEHHIQMLDDQQTHSIPESDEIAQHLAVFLGYSNKDEFEQELFLHCRRVREIYADSVQSTPPLSLGGNLVFTGVENDPATIRTLKNLGFNNAPWVSEQIQQWHRGHRRATRSIKARQLLTELIPSLLKAFSETVDANDAFKRFDEFLARVPVGVQIFSLLGANQDILTNLATLLGSAPALGDTLTHNPALLDLLLEQESDLPATNELPLELAKTLHHCEDYEQALRALRQFKQEKQFSIGIRALQNRINTQTAAQHLSALTDTITEQTYRLSLHDYSNKVDIPDDFEFAIIGLGKLGTSEMTFDSDLDLIFLYQSTNGVFAQRFAARLMHAFTLQSKEGQLYELDLRLRPGGSGSPMATSIGRFENYFTQDGWDVEALALTRARIIHSSCSLFSQRIENSIHNLLDSKFEPSRLANSIADLRAKIAKQLPSSDPWDIKYHEGGLIDISLITQYLRLTNPSAFECKIGQTVDVMLEAAKNHSLLCPTSIQELMNAYRLQRRLQHVLRLCSIKQTIDEHSSISLQTLVARLMNQPDCIQLKQDLTNSQQQANKIFQQLFSRG